jgi:hypothetical protein
MMDHTGLVKLDRNYFQTHVLELAEEYLNAVPNLTIDDSERLRLQIKSKDEIIKESDSNLIEKYDKRLAKAEKLILQLLHQKNPEVNPDKDRFTIE